MILYLKLQNQIFNNNLQLVWIAQPQSLKRGNPDTAIPVRFEFPLKMYK